jgi:High potential iron-sulfur protein
MNLPGKAPPAARSPVAARREFLVLLAGTAGLVLAGRARAQLAPLPETDPTAQALGYRADAAQVDAARFPQHTAAQHCANCNFFQPGEGGSGGCQLFPGKSVSAKGWCSAYAAKPG